MNLGPEIVFHSIEDTEDRIVIYVNALQLKLETMTFLFVLYLSILKVYYHQLK